VTDAHGADQLGHRQRPGLEQAGTALTPTWPREHPQWCHADRDWLAALGPVSPRPAQPRGAGDPPKCDGPAIRAHERAGSDCRRAPEIRGAVGDLRPEVPARARPTARRPARTTVAIRAGAARLDTHDQWLVGGARRRPELSHRGERQRSEGLSHGGEGRRSGELSHRGGDRRGVTRRRRRPDPAAQGRAGGNGART
jgi:hypothetical protein